MKYFLRPHNRILFFGLISMSKLWFLFLNNFHIWCLNKASQSLVHLPNKLALINLTNLLICIKRKKNVQKEGLYIAVKCKYVELRAGCC